MFSPSEHGFIKLDMVLPGGVEIYEHDREGIDQTNHDPMRLNTYLSRDADFVTVWWGLIDATMVEITLGFDDDPSFSFREQYDEPLFRGYIATSAAAATILEALRYEKRVPNVLSLTDEGKLECHALFPTNP